MRTLIWVLHYRILKMPPKVVTLTFEGIFNFNLAYYTLNNDYILSGISIPSNDKAPLSVRDTSEAI